MDNNAPRKKRSTGAKNRRRGNRYECTVASRLREIHPHIITSRAGNRARDAEGIDLCNANEHKHGQLPISVQCKATNKQPNFPELLNRIDGPLPIVFWAQTEADKGGRFQFVGEFVTMKAEDFLQLYATANSKQPS